MSRKYRLVGGWWVDPAEHSFWMRVNGGAWTEQPLLSLGGAARYLYVSQDDVVADDIVSNIIADLYAAIAVAAVGYGGSGFYSGFDLATGIITISYDNSDSDGAVDVRFDHPTDPNAHNNSYFLHDLLRMTATPTSTISWPGSVGGGSVVGTRCHGYGFYPVRYLMDDRDDFQARVSQAVPDVGMPQTLRTSMRRRHLIGIRTDKSYPRGVIFNEYHQLVDFMENAATGRPFRLYPDVTVFTPYADQSAPFGYSTYVLDKDSASWRPEPVSGNWYALFDTSLLAWEV